MNQISHSFILKSDNNYIYIQLERNQFKWCVKSSSNVKTNSVFGFKISIFKDLEKLRIICS